MDSPIAELEELLDDRDRKVDEGWSFGERVRVIEDDEDEGLFAGTEGWLLIERLGAAEYGSLRTAVFFVEEPLGMRDPVEIRDPSLIEGA